MVDNKRTVYRRSGTPWLEPVQIASSTVARRAAAPETCARVVSVLERLEPDDYSEYMVAYLRQGLERFGADWGYMDLLTTLHAAAVLLAPEHYLEIGVRRGRSLAVVADARPECHMVGFDLWVDNYAGMPNPGPEFVRQEMRKVGHRGTLDLVSGDSRATVPEFLTGHPELMFDVITVDGDHTEAGARADLANVLPRLKLGGVLVMDDVAHPEHPHLAALWEEVVGRDPGFASHTYRELGYGVALAVRRSEQAP